MSTLTWGEVSEHTYHLKHEGCEHEGGWFEVQGPGPLTGGGCLEFVCVTQV